MIIIKNKILNIIIFILVFLSTAAVLSGADAGIDENTIYSMKNLSKYERSIGEMRLLVSNMKNAVDKEEKNFDNSENNEYLNTIIDINSQIKQLKFYNGFTYVRGPGIMLSVSDSVIEDPNLDLMERIVHDVDIVVLLNDLKEGRRPSALIQLDRLKEKNQANFKSDVRKIDDIEMAKDQYTNIDFEDSKDLGQDIEKDVLSSFG